MKESAIKLFGKTIALAYSDKAVSVSDTSTSHHDTKHESGGDSNSAGIRGSTTTSLSETNSDEEEKTVTKNNSKPDIIIACPRCKSMETKFCYYNNYNLNQPRHFCKNCQRYWTSGGTMRNVPVGSGRRKNKNAAVNLPKQILIPEAQYSNTFLITPSGFPVTFYPAAFHWGGSNSSVQFSSPTSVLGKHSREEGAGLFQTRHDHRREMLLQANPAALSRSLNFHETV